MERFMRGSREFYQRGLTLTFCFDFCSDGFLVDEGI